MLVTALALLPLLCVPDPDRNLIELARNAVIAEVLGKPTTRVERRSTVRPVFVTIERNGQVLGCRGSLEPRTASLEEEVVSAARGAAAHDPRYRPIAKSDLPGFLVTVTVVEGTHPISSVDGLEPGDGLVLKAGNRTGVVLPWEGKDPSIRLQWAYRKAGVATGSPAQLFRMVASRSRG